MVGMSLCCVPNKSLQSRKVPVTVVLQRKGNKQTSSVVNFIYKLSE